MYAVIYRKHFSINRISKALPSSSGFSLHIGIGYFVGHASSIIMVYDALVSVFFEWQSSRLKLDNGNLHDNIIVRYFH